MTKQHLAIAILILALLALGGGFGIGKLTHDGAAPAETVDDTLADKISNDRPEGIDDDEPSNEPGDAEDGGTTLPDENNDSDKAPVQVLSEIVWGNRAKQQIIMTFDAGAGAHSHDEILATLAKHNVKGTFFITGKWAEQNPSRIREINDRGHEIFNHTYSHPDLTSITDAQIREEFAATEAIIKNITGKTTKPYFRPPYGARNTHVRTVLAHEGYRSIYWTVDALDWKPGITESEVTSRIYTNLAPGAIVMMHVGDDITGNVLDEVLTEIKSRGYTPVSLTQGL